MDEYIKTITKKIRKLGTELKIIANWYNLGVTLSQKDEIDEIFSNDCLLILVDNDKHYESINKRKINLIEIKDQFIWEQIWKPKIFTFCSYLREFLTLLKKYENDSDIEKNNRYLKYWSHLIFKTGLYSNKKFINSRDIKTEIDIINSVISEPLHAFSISYNINFLDNKDIIEESFKNFVTTKISNLNFTGYFSNKNLDYKKSFYYNFVENKVQNLFEIIQNYDINENSLSKEILCLEKGMNEEYLKYSKLDKIDKNHYDLENFLMWSLEYSNRKKSIDAFDYMIEKRKNKNSD